MELNIKDKVQQNFYMEIGKMYSTKKSDMKYSNIDD